MSIDILKKLRESTVKPHTCGLPDKTVESFIAHDPLLARAIEEASVRLEQLGDEFPELVKLDEEKLINELSSDFVNFYPAETVSPYVPLAAKGPWIVTIGGAVVYDTGGYGMLGIGHDPDCLRQSLSRSQAMANIMTPSFSHHRFTELLEKKIGHLRSGKNCPYAKFISMNSGSEGMAVALRISDSHARRLTDPGGKHQGKEIKILSFLGSFHGRTCRPGRISSSSREKYDAALASFRDHSEHVEVRVNDASHLRELYERFNKENIYIEALALEPVMGEGNPGQPLSREFYDVARELTKKNDSLLIIDSIQAGIRAQGVLSVVDYPDFVDCDPPDMEVFSKALNGGQFPLSVVALQQWAADEYVTGTYGNTMTSNPRALDIATDVLNELTPELTKNVQERGKEFVEKLNILKNEFPDTILKVQGTGLLISAELRKDLPVVGFTGVEQEMRKHGVNVIHGGENAIRFTPWFHITSEEIDLIIDNVRTVLKAAT